VILPNPKTWEDYQELLQSLSAPAFHLSVFREAVVKKSDTVFRF
jgi:hypothetical protein